MKKILFAISAVALLSGISTSCQKEAKPVQEKDQNAEFTITATVADIDTRVSYSENGTTHTLKPTWEIGDVLIGFDNATPAGTYGFRAKSVNPTTGAATFGLIKTGEYAGTVKSAPADGTVLYLVYAPGTAIDSIDVTKKALTVNIAVQTRDVIPALMMASDTVKEGKLSLIFENKTAVIGIKQPTMAAANTAYSCIALSGTGLNTEVKFDLSGANGAFKATYKTPGVISKGVDFTSASDKSTTEVTYIAVCPTETATDILFVSNYLETFKKTGKELAAGNYYYMHPTFAGGHAEGILPGLFSVDETTIIGFSKGNLHATCTKAGEEGESEYSWGFAENQLDTIGYASGNATIANQTLGAKVSLFGWVGASSTKWPDTTDVRNYGLTTSCDNPDRAEYGTVLLEPIKKDWGTTIDKKGTWITPTSFHYLYLLGDSPDEGKYTPTKRIRAASTINGVTNARGCMATVNGIIGWIIFPDNYTHPSGVKQPKAYAKWRKANMTASDNIFSLEDWSKMEAAGAVILSMERKRVKGNIKSDIGGFYWCSNSAHISSDSACVVTLNTTDPVVGNGAARVMGNPVRLVSIAK